MLSASNNIKYGVEEYIAPISIAEAAQRIIRCGEALGMTNQKQVAFDDIRNEYKDLYGTELNKEELRMLFGYVQANKALRVISNYINVECRQGGLFLKLTRPNICIKNELDELIELDTLDKYNKIPVVEGKKSKLSKEELEKLIEEMDAIIKRPPSIKSDDADNERSGDFEISEEKDDVYSDEEEDFDNEDEISDDEVPERSDCNEDSDLESRSVNAQNLEGNNPVNKKKFTPFTPKVIVIDYNADPSTLPNDHKLSLTFDQLEKFFIKTQLPEENKLANLPINIYHHIEPEIDEFEKFDNEIRKAVKDWFTGAKEKLSEELFLADLDSIITTMKDVYDKREKKLIDLNEKLNELFDKYLPLPDEEDEERDSDFDLMY